MKSLRDVRTQCDVELTRIPCTHDTHTTHIGMPRVLLSDFDPLASDDLTPAHSVCQINPLTGHARASLPLCPHLQNAQIHTQHLDLAIQTPTQHQTLMQTLCHCDADPD